MLGKCHTTPSVLRQHYSATLLLLVTIVSGCNLSYIPQENVSGHDSIDKFIQSLSSSWPLDAYDLLAQDIQKKVPPEVIVNANGDFQPILEAFKQAGVTAGSQYPKDEISYIVPKLRGRDGAVIFVLTQEDGLWKIANLFEDTTSGPVASPTP